MGIFKSVNRWAKKLGKKRVISSELAFSSRIRHYHEGTTWFNGLKEEKVSIFGKDTVPFNDVLLKHGAKEGDIVMLDVHHGSVPPIDRKTSLGTKMLYESGTIRLYTPEGELKSRIIFNHGKDKIDMKKYSPAGRWIGKRVNLKE